MIVSEMILQPLIQSTTFDPQVDLIETLYKSHSIVVYIVAYPRAVSYFKSWKIRVI